MFFKDEYAKANDDIMLDNYTKESIFHSMKKAQNKPCAAVHHKKKNVRAYIAVAAVIVMVLSSISIIAANTWGEDLKEYFNWMNKNYNDYNLYDKSTADLNSDNFLSFEQIAEFGKDINVSEEKNNFTVTINKIIFDNASLYAEIDITAPSDINLAVLNSEDDSLAINPMLTGDNIAGYTTSSFENKLKKTGINDAGQNMWKLYTRFVYYSESSQNVLHNASILFNGIEAVLPESGNETEILSIMLPNDISSNVYSIKSDNDYLVTAKKNYLVEHDADAETDTIETIVNNVVLTPLSISYTQYVEWNDKFIYAPECRIIFKDGTYLYFNGIDRNSDNSQALIAHAFPMPINLENVEDVIIGGASIDFN